MSQFIRSLSEKSNATSLPLLKDILVRQEAAGRREARTGVAPRRRPRVAPAPAGAAARTSPVDCLRGPGPSTALWRRGTYAEKAGASGPSLLRCLGWTSGRPDGTEELLHVVSILFTAGTRQGLGRASEARGPGMRGGGRRGRMTRGDVGRPCLTRVDGAAPSQVPTRAADAMRLQRSGDAIPGPRDRFDRRPRIPKVFRSRHPMCMCFLLPMYCLPPPRATGFIHVLQLSVKFESLNNFRQRKSLLCVRFRHDI